MTVPSTEMAEQSAVPENTDVTAAESSPAEKGVGSYAEAIEAALRPEATPASNEQDQEDPESGSKEETPQVDVEAEAQAEIQQLSQKAQNRFRELVGAKKQLEAEVAPLREQVETLKPKAEQLDRLTGYMREHAIEPTHLDNAMALTAMINRGDAKVVPILEGLLAQVRQRTGDTLPPELQQQVNLGYLTEAHARELSRTRVAAQRSEAQAREAQERSSAERAQREAETITNRAAMVADTWNQEQVTKDPDWNLKRDLVAQEMELQIHRLGAEGYPRTDKAVRDLLDKAKSAVEAKLKPFRPAPKPISTPTGGAASPRSAAKPASYADAIDIGLSRAG